MKMKPACPIGIDDNMQDNKVFKIYPNPTKSIITVELKFENTQNVTLTVVDLLGKEVLSRKLGYISTASEVLDLTGNRNGSYIVVAQSGNLTLRKTIILRND